MTDVRLQYELAVAALARQTSGRLASGESEEQVARWVVGERNRLKQQYRDMTPADALEVIEAWTLGQYGNVLGPSAEQLRAAGKSWATVIAGACRPGTQPLRTEKPGDGCA